MEKTKQIIAIDGPAGAGKSTVSKKIAQILGFTYIDTGSMYRAIAWLILENNLQIPLQTSQITDLLHKIDLKLLEDKVLLNGQDISLAIREPRISQVVSEISAIPEVRSYLLFLQQEMGKAGQVVLDGRDIGTTVFPQAGLKIFLLATVEERAIRRAKQQQEMGIQQSLKEVQEEIKKRDYSDYNRQISPLKQADDALLINTDGLSITEVIKQIIHLAQARFNLRVS